MRVLYHLPVLPPKHPTAEALSQEISSLSHQFNGSLNYINPNQNSPIYIPRFLFGLHQLSRLRHLEQSIDVHHVFNPDPFAYPLFRLLKKPVVYTLSSRVSAQKPNVAYFSKLAGVTVYDRKSEDQLRQWGLKNVHFIQPGIDSSRFSQHPLPAENAPFLIASAPWVERHFAEKGIDVLLDTAVNLPDLHLTFLWRGELMEEMMARVNGRNLQNRVQVINKVVDVNDALANSIATINLATHAGVVKAYPHSLMDSLAAGRPVIISDTLAMADDVSHYHFGVVVNEISVDNLIQAIQSVRSNIVPLWQAATAHGRELYGLEQVIGSYERVYEEVIATVGSLE